LNDSAEEIAMMNRWMGVGLFSAGAVIGVAVAGLRQEPVASAQADSSWTAESTRGVDAVGPWLGAAARVQISTAGLEVSGRYILACKQ
jgi:hypothetical protein